MKQVLVVLLAVVLCAPATIRASQDDVSAPVRQFIDGFNTGNVQAAFAAYATGVITIVDEFAPHIWTGPDAAHQWADAYDKHAQATGVTDGRVTTASPRGQKLREMWPMWSCRPYTSTKSMGENCERKAR